MIVHIHYNLGRQTTDVFRNAFQPIQFARISDDKRCGDTEDMLIQLEDLQKSKNGDSDMANWLFTELVAIHGLIDREEIFMVDNE